MFKCKHAQFGILFWVACHLGGEVFPILSATIKHWSCACTNLSVSNSYFTPSYFKLKDINHKNVWENMRWNQIILKSFFFFIIVFVLCILIFVQHLNIMIAVSHLLTRASGSHLVRRSYKQKNMTSGVVNNYGRGVEMFCDGKHFHGLPQTCRQFSWPSLEYVKTFCTPIAQSCHILTCIFEVEYPKIFAPPPVKAFLPMSISI